MLLKEHADLFSFMSDSQLKSLFHKIDEDASNSISFDEFYNTLMRWHDDHRAARDRKRRLRESVCWQGDITKRDFVSRVRSVSRREKKRQAYIGREGGRVWARGHLRPDPGQAQQP